MRSGLRLSSSRRLNGLLLFRLSLFESTVVLVSFVDEMLHRSKEPGGLAAVEERGGEERLLDTQQGNSIQDERRSGWCRASGGGSGCGGRWCGGVGGSGSGGGGRKSRMRNGGSWLSIGSVLFCTRLVASGSIERRERFRLGMWS